MPKPWEQFEAQDPEELIKQSAAKYGADPKLVRAIAKTESNFNPKAVSPKGAKGVMQLMPKTAKSLGVKDPFDMAQNIEGGAKLAGQLTTQYGGDRAKIAAAYNAGQPAVDKAGGIPDIPETKDYVQKVEKEYQASGGAKPWEQFADNTNELRKLHERHLAEGKYIESVGGLNTAAAAVRGAAPAVAAALSLTPAAPAAPLIYGLGEFGGQALEKLAGSREGLNPYSIATATALGRLPLPDFAKKLAARTPFPKVAYPLFKAPEGYAQGAAFTLAQHGIGKMTAGLPGAEGEEPTWSGGEANTAGMAGGAIATLGALARVHSITREARDINYKTAGNQSFRGIGMPQRGQRAEFMSKTFDNWFPIMHQYAQETGTKVDTLNDLRNTSDKLSSDHYQNVYLPLVEPIKQQQVSTQPIYEAVNNFLSNNPTLMRKNPTLKESLLKEVESYKNSSKSINDLLKERASDNEEKKAVMKRINTAQDFSTSISNRADLIAINARRGVLDGAVESYYKDHPEALPNGFNHPDVGEILKNQRDIMTMRDHIEEASQSWDAMKRYKAGERGKIASAVIRAVSRTSARGGVHSLAGSGLAEGYGMFNNPDALVRSSFKLLKNITPSYQLPIVGKGPGPQTGQTQPGIPPIPVPTNLTQGNNTP